ncbi:MAG: hypothetical protein HQL95_15930 [Magnetococcales bacterium]|nr:hypothetical protein [Magnetococcales bacterium]
MKLDLKKPEFRLTRPAWMETLSRPPGEVWGLLKDRLTKKQSAGMAGLYATGEGVGLVHVVPGQDHRMRLNVCAFQPLTKGQSPGKIAQGMIKSHKLEKAPYVGVLDRTTYLLLPAEAPDLPREEWSTAMKWRVKDQVGFPVSQAVVETFDMPGNTPDSDSGRIYVAVAKEVDVRKQVQLFHEAGVALHALDIHELALINLTRHLPEDAEGMALLHLEAKSGLVIMIKNGCFYLSRRIETGLSALMDSLGPDGSGIAQAPYMDRVALEAQRTMDYFESHFGQSPASSLYVAPLPVPVEGLRPALAERLGMRIRFLPAEEILEIPEGVPEENIARALLVIGAAMGRSHTPP